MKAYVVLNKDGVPFVIHILIIFPLDVKFSLQEMLLEKLIMVKDDNWKLLQIYLQ